MLFNEHKISQIRSMYKSGWSRKELAKVFGCSYSTVNSIVHNLSYVDPNYRTVKKPILDLEYAIKLRRQGKSHAEIATILGKNSGRQYSQEHIRRTLLKEMAVADDN